MKNTILTFSILFIILTVFADDIKPQCYTYNSTVSARFQIQTLYNSTTDYLENTTLGTLHYNFCNKVLAANSTTCQANTSAVIINKHNNTCLSLTNGTIPKFYALDPSNPLAGLILSYPPGQIISGTGATYNYTVVLNCSPRSNFSFSNLTVNGAFDQNYTIEASANEGCPSFAFYQLNRFVEKYKILFILIGTAVGVSMAFFGLKLLKLTFFLTGFSIISLIMIFFLFTYAFGNDPSIPAQWCCLCASLAVGVLGGFLLIRFQKPGIFFLGAGFGTVCSFLVYGLVLFHFRADELAFSLFSVFTALCCGVLALALNEHLVIVSTSITGSYFAIRSISLIAPSESAYPSELEIAREIEYEVFTHIRWVFYVYLGAILILASVAIWFQYREKRKRDTERRNSGSSEGSYSSLSI